MRGYLYGRSFLPLGYREAVRQRQRLVRLQIMLRLDAYAEWAKRMSKAIHEETAV